MTHASSHDSRYQSCRATLTGRGQQHVLRWWDELDPGQREHLLADLESIPWDVVDPLIPSHVLQRPHQSIPTDLSPPEVYKQEPRPEQKALYEQAVGTGRDLLRAGKVAAFTVAGGQGIRLGFDGPKGTVTISPVRRKTLFQLFAEMIKAAGAKYGVSIPWYIMTNPANHEQTLRFLGDHEFFGLSKSDVSLFPQALLPAFDSAGRIFLEDKHRVALGPDGHGGSLRALVQSGSLEEMRARGVEVISYFQVDNPLVKPFDPLFIGLHTKTGSEMSIKVTPKADDLECVGNVCVQDGKVIVIEYSTFPEELAHAVSADGNRTFDAGNLAIHLLNVDFVDRIIARRFQLPYHRVDRHMSWMDEHGLLRTPADANAVKLETFVFDALPLAGKPLVLEVDRAEEFSPVKKAEGVDSVETAIRDQIRRAARWLEAAGVTIPRKPNGEPDAIIEIAPEYALEAADVVCRMKQPTSIDRNETVFLEV